MSGRKATGTVGQMLEQTAANHLAAPIPAVDDIPTDGIPANGETKQADTRATPPKRRSRRFEQTHPAFRFRIRPEDNDRITAQARDLEISRDRFASALIQAALDALDQGHLRLEVHKEVVSTKDIQQRTRHRVRVTVSWSWSCGE